MGDQILHRGHWLLFGWNRVKNTKKQKWYIDRYAEIKWMWMILFQNASARSMQNRFRFVNVLARGRCKNEARWKADRRHLYCVRVSAIGRWHFWLVFNQIKRFANTTCFNVLFPFIYSWFLAFSFRLALIYLFLLSFLIRFFLFFFILHSLTFPVLFLPRFNTHSLFCAFTPVVSNLFLIVSSSLFILYVFFFLLSLIVSFFPLPFIPAV